MAAHIDGPKADPAEVAGQALDGVEKGAFEVVADEVSRRVRAGLPGDLAGSTRAGVVTVRRARRG